MAGKYLLLGLSDMVLYASLDVSPFCDLTVLLNVFLITLFSAYYLLFNVFLLNFKFLSPNEQKIQPVFFSVLQAQVVLVDSGCLPARIYQA
jgi:hypothetical protein